ncbi:hypothetical protein QBC43DRAFT_352703 [Cladorrhinum sp. PSN259]|nr:hypothetical protein QBC43DRAFT_352703 [Cladorrhinum sp. PSN259]
MPLGTPPAVSPAALRTIKNAFRDLEKSLSVADRRNLQDTTLDDVRRAATMVQDQLAARQSLRNMRRLLPLFDGLSYYSKSIEVLCNGTPYMCWIWAPLKVILKVASDYVEAFERIIQGYCRIAEPLARFKLLDQTHSKNVHIQEALAVFYADILEFHQNAYKFVCRSGWKVLFLSSWGRFQRTFDSIFENLQRHEELIDKTAAAVDVSEAKEMRDALHAWRRESREQLEKEGQDKASLNFLTIVGWLKVNESDQDKIFESISSEPRSFPGTTGWITKNHKIASWMRANHEKTFLVLHGHPGTGKSALASEIATFLRSDNVSLIVTHFCTYLYASSIEYDQILKSILVQLIRSNADLISHAYDQLIRQKKAPTSQVLERLICDLIISAAESPSQTSYIHIIVDGLDECAEDQKKRVIKILERFVSVASSQSSGATICKVLVSTRTTQRSLSALRQKQTITLSEEKHEVTRSIKQYASQKIAKLSDRLRQLGITDEDIQDVVHGIAEKADGMFLWARLVLEYLATGIFYTRQEVLTAANTLPRKLSEFYGQIISQLLSRPDERSVTRIKMILGWVAFAKRPLRKAEFRSALAFSDGNTAVSELPPPYIFEECAPLIEIRNDSSFAFIHVSVKDFLESSESNLALTEASAYSQHCLSAATCLLSGLETMTPPYPEFNRNLRILRGIHAFHNYATEYWAEYLLAVATSESGIDTQSPFFLVSSRLAKALTKLNQGSDHSPKSLVVTDERLKALGEYIELHAVVTRSISDREPNGLGLCDADTDSTHSSYLDPKATCKITSLGSLLLLYQTVVKRLLGMRTVPGIGLEDFERFKIEFRTTAFGCRLLSCPRASLGFDSEAQLAEHEASHLRIVCDVPGCQYPTFSSIRALKTHKRQRHPEETRTVQRRGIRRPRPQSPSTESSGALGEQQRSPRLFDSITSGIPELQNSVADLREATYVPIQNMIEIRDTTNVEEDSGLSIQVNDPMAMEESELLPEDFDFFEDDDMVVSHDQLIEPNIPMKVDDDGDVATAKVEGELLSYIHQFKGDVSSFTLEERARRVLRTHGLSMSDGAIRLMVSRLRATPWAPPISTTSAPTKVSFPVSEGSALVGSMYKSPSSFHSPGYTDDFDFHHYLSSFISVLKEQDYDFKGWDVVLTLDGVVRKTSYRSYAHFFWVNVMKMVPHHKTEDPVFWTPFFDRLSWTLSVDGFATAWEAIAGSLAPLTDDAVSWKAWAAAIAGFEWAKWEALHPVIWSRLYKSISPTCEHNFAMWVMLLKGVPPGVLCKKKFHRDIMKSVEWDPSFVDFWEKSIVSGFILS